MNNNLLAAENLVAIFQRIESGFKQFLIFVCWNLPLGFAFVSCTSGWNKLIIVRQGNFSLTPDYWTDFAIQLVLFLYSHFWIWYLLLISNLTILFLDFWKKHFCWQFMFYLMCLVQFFFGFFLQVKLIGKILL